MIIEKADVVISLNGRDKDKRFIVVGTEDEYSLIADGRGRRIEKPKRKKNKHLRLEGRLGGKTADKLAGGEKVANSEIRRALAAYAAEDGTTSKSDAAQSSETAENETKKKGV